MPEQWFSFGTTTIEEIRDKGKRFIIFFDKKLYWPNGTDEEPPVPFPVPFLKRQNYLEDVWFRKNRPDELFENIKINLK